MSWTDEDTAICERAEASGLAYDKYTGKPLTIDTMKELAKDFDMVRDIMSIDEFMEKRIYSVPMDGWKKRHYDIAKKSDEMFKTHTEGDEIDI
jgi:hypothetical protein